MDTNSKADDIASAADLVASAFESLFDRCDEEASEICEELRGDNEDVIYTFMQANVTADEIFNHPEVQKLLKARVASIMEHFTYMNEDP